VTGELTSDAWRGSGGRLVRRILDLRSDPLGGIGRAEREVAGTVDGIVSDPAELGVHGTNGIGTGLITRSCGKQGMVKLGVPSRLSQHACRFCVSPPIRSTDRHQRRQCWAGKQCRCEDSALRRRWQRGHPRRENRSMPLWNRKLPDTRRKIGSRPGNLDRQIWVAVGKAVQRGRPRRTWWLAQPEAHDIGNLGLRKRPNADYCPRLGKK
jgi:hypothetical protein